MANFVVSFVLESSCTDQYTAVLCAKLPKNFLMIHSFPNRLLRRFPFGVIFGTEDLFLDHGADNVADHDVALLNFGGFA